MKKGFNFLLLLIFLFSNFSLGITSFENNLSNIINTNIQVDILKDGINENNAGKMMQQILYTDGKMKLENLKFEVVKGVKVSIDNNIKSSFNISNKTRNNFTIANTNKTFKAKANYYDKIIEYPDRVRIISQTEYTYNNKTEYDKIFTGLNNNEVLNSREVNDFLNNNPEYQKYSNGVNKLNKKDLIDKLTNKIFQDCISKNRNTPNSCQLNTIKNGVVNEVNSYKGTRIVTETIDVNKIPMIYDADKNKEFTQRLIESNISLNPENVRISTLELKNAFSQYINLNNMSIIDNDYLQSELPTNRTCEGLNGQAKTNCNIELSKLNSNNSGTNQPLEFNETLLNGFTLGQSYSYTLSDSFSVLGFTVYDIGVSFYAGYGVGIRIPIEVNVVVDKDRLEMGVSENYTATVEVDTKDKDYNWFKNALGDKKAFDGKEAVLEAGAYAKGWIILFEQTVFNEQIGGKHDWGKNIKMPFGNNEKLKLFSGIVEGNDIGLELILYGVHISGDLKVDGYIQGDITYECRTLSSNGLNQDASNCQNIDNTSLKDEDIDDIKVDPISKTNTFDLQGYSDKFYYKNDLGVYQKYGISLQRFKYKPDLNVDLFLRGKVGVDTGDYFGWIWIKTPWLKVYSFEIDLPTLSAHSGYIKKSVDTFDNSYLYNFNNTKQDIPDGFDDSTKIDGYQVDNKDEYYSLNGLSNNEKSNKNQAYLFGGKILIDSFKNPVYQMNIPIGYYTIITESINKLFHGYIRYHGEGNNFFNDYIVKKKGAEIVGISNNIGVDNNNVLFYYSNATNSIWGANLGGGSQDQKNIKSKILNDTKIISLPGTNCFNESKTRQEDCPVANIFNYFGGVDSFGKLNDTNGVYFPFKKFNFALHPFFSTSTNNQFFAYIAHTNDENNYKIKIYKNGNWGEIQDSLLGNPYYVQIVDDDSLIVVYINFNESTQKYSYNIQKYIFDNYWNSSRYYIKAFDGIDNITDLYYDETEKTLYVSSFELSDNGKYEGKISSIRFNGINNVPFIQNIYSYQLSNDLFTNNFKSLKTWNWTTDSLVNQNNTGFVDTFISSINIDLENNNIYLNLYANNGNNGMQFIQKLNYNKFPMMIGESMQQSFSQENGEQNDNQDELLSYNNYTLTGNNEYASGLSIDNTKKQEYSQLDYNSDDEYVNYKLNEINKGFVQYYTANIDNIDKIIDSLEKESFTHTEKEKIVYDLAVNKLQEIKKILINRYKFILDYDNL